MSIRAAIESVVELVNPSAQRDDGLGMQSKSVSASKEGLQSSKEDLATPSPLKKHAHTFMSPELASARRNYLVIVIRTIFVVIVLMWTCLPIYWSSLASSAQLTNNLTGWVIDRDMNRIGPNISAAILDASTGPGTLGWISIPADVAGEDEDIAQAVIGEQAWIAVVIEANATTKLTAARQSGNTSYDPNSAITVYYNQARNEVAASNFILPFTTNLLQAATTAYATGSTQRYLAAVMDNGNDVNATAIQLIAKAPQTMTPGIAWTMVNLRPYTAPVALAVTLVGQIYLCIFAFITTMANATARAYIQPYLTLPSYIAVRVIYPLLAYIPLSLSYAMISLPFKLPFGAKYTYGGGFFTFFVYIYMGMCALGLSIEAMVTLMTPRFVPCFLVLLIIVNISTAELPPDLQIGLFSYGAGLPVWNIQQAIRTIIFNTDNHLGINAAVLIAWTILSCATICLFTWLTHRYTLRPFQFNIFSLRSRKRHPVALAPPTEDEKITMLDSRMKLKGKAKDKDKDFDSKENVGIVAVSSDLEMQIESLARDGSMEMGRGNKSTI